MPRVWARIVVILLAFQGFANPAFAQKDVLPLTIIHYNDFHSQNTPLQMEIEHAGAKQLTDVGGAAVLKSYIDLFKRTHPNAVVMDAGDDFQGSPVSTLTRGESQIEILDAIRPDAMTLGNHEFDYGADNLRTLLRKLTFPVINSNYFDKSTGRMFITPFVLLLARGVRLGVIGLGPADLKALSVRDNVRNIAVLKAETVLRQILPTIRDSLRADAVVVLSHMGLESDTALAREIPGIDVIVGGHSHTVLQHPLRIGDTYVVQAGDKGRWLGVLDCEVDTAANRIVSATGRLVRTVAKDVTPDPAVDSIVRRLESVVDEKFRERIATLETDWKRGRDKKESTVGDWIADVMRDYAKADAAFMNNGGIRKDLPAGPVTVRDIWEICPFDNEIVTFTATGTQLMQMLRAQAATGREFCQVSGVRYRFDPSQPGDRTLQVTVGGAPLDPEKTYTIATNSFIGGHLHDAFGLPEAGITVTSVAPGVSMRDVLVDAARAQRDIRSPLDGRIDIVER